MFTIRIKKPLCPQVVFNQWYERIERLGKFPSHHKRKLDSSVVRGILCYKKRLKNKVDSESYLTDALTQASSANIYWETFKLKIVKKVIYYESNWKAIDAFHIYRLYRLQCFYDYKLGVIGANSRVRSLFGVPGSSWRGRVDGYCDMD